MDENSVMNGLKLDQIQEAFEKAREDINIPGFKLVLVTPEYYDKAMDFIRDHFITKEAVHLSAGLEWTDEVKTICLQTFKLNLSLMIIDEQTEEAAAILRTSVQSKDSSESLDNIQTKSLKEAMRFNNICDEYADFFGHFGTDEAFHVEALAVAEKHQRKGLATNIFKATVDMISKLGIDPVYIKVEGSSIYSKKVFEAAGFETLSEKSFDSWQFPIQIKRSGVNTSQKNYGLRIANKM
ncbi:uncharacterized protein LOC123563019 [Mercenaria mercenaria]|uniref:uncharacterized protein LOC123563019 n=1 Tax=Mercenaria mercenaria TaxID=6596 RepID=UPI00234F09ED|nr:uncharacterized protein LOC123563019 [Mercenaria mercenaria]